MFERKTNCKTSQNDRSTYAKKREYVILVFDINTYSSSIIEPSKIPNRIHDVNCKIILNWKAATAEDTRKKCLKLWLDLI